MRTQRQQYYGLLKADVFLLCLLILLINDFYLKFQFPGFITGKLSDFAGLFAFPFFLSIFLPKKALTIYILTGVLFVFWKLPTSDWIIDSFNSLDLFLIHRVKDLTDLIALAVLPLSFKYFELQKNKVFSLSRSQFSFLLLFSVFTFTADTIGHQEYRSAYFINASYLFPVNKNLLIKNHFSTVYTGIPINLSDSLFYIEFTHPSKRRVDIFFNAKIKSFNKDSTIIKIDSVTRYEIENEGLFSGPKASTIEEMKSLDAADFKSLIEKKVIFQILRKDTTANKRFYMRSKRTEDSLNRNYH